MKRITIILIFVQILIACKDFKKIQVSDYLDRIERTNELFSKNKNSKQIFTASTKDQRIIEAKNGFQFLFSANQLEAENGSTLADSITIEVIECLNQADFVKSKIQTISDDRLLVSDGAYNISMLSKGNTLKLKANDSLTVYLPRFTKDNMELFYGKKDSIGQVHWEKTGKKLIPQRLGLAAVSPTNDTTFYNFEDEYSPIKIKTLDWINCDRFYDIKEKTNCGLSLETTQDTLVVCAYLIFIDINSVISTVYIKSGKNILNRGFKNIPLNANVRFVAVSIIENKIYGFSKDIKIQENDKVKINLSQMTEQEVDELINKK